MTRSTGCWRVPTLRCTAPRPLGATGLRPPDSSLKLTPAAKGWCLARPLVSLRHMAQAPRQQGCGANHPGMGDPRRIQAQALCLVPSAGHALHEVGHTLLAAKSMPTKICGPAVEVGLRDAVPALALPTAKVHLHQARIGFIGQIRP